MSVGRTPVRFASPATTPGSGECVGELSLPEVPLPAPVVVMAHGLGAERSFGLERFAERFTARGLAVLAFDYRNFGESTGTPRNLISPSRQVADFLAAIEWIRSEPRLDGDRIGLWGTSFSGGHVLVVGARAESRVQAIVAQVPFVSGISSALAFPLRYHPRALLMGFIDTIGGTLGAPPLTAPVVARDGMALLPGPDAYAGYTALVPEGADWSGRVPSRAFLSILLYRPVARTARLSVPTLIIAAGEDRIIPVRGVRRAAARIPNCHFEEWPVGHFDLYSGEWFERTVALEADFLEARLQP